MNTVLGTEFSQKALLNRICYFTMGREAVLMLREQESTVPSQKEGKDRVNLRKTWT